MNVPSLTGKSFSVTDSGGNSVQGVASYDESDRSVMFIRPVGLGYATTYTATIKSDVSDLAGNVLSSDYSWSFTTASEPDTEAPFIEAVSPPDGENDVSPNAAITAKFSEAMNVPSLTGKSFSVTDSGGNSVQGVASYDESDRSVMFIRPVGLGYATTYTATIKSDVSDLAGNVLSSDYSWSFTTASEPDTSGPLVESVKPDDNGKDILLNATISAKFTEAMDPMSITEESFFLSDESASRVQGTLEYDEFNMTAIFEPSGLDYGTTYTATIRRDVRDISGNPPDQDYSWSFMTITEPDMEPPSVTFVSPSDGKNDVPVNTSVSVAFTEPVQESSLSEAIFIINDKDEYVPGTLHYDDKTIVFVPDSDLTYDTDYTVTITADVEDFSGNPLPNDYVWTFRTGTEPDMTQPDIVSFEPLNNADDVPVDTTIIVTFSEPVNPSDISPDTFFINDDISVISGKISHSEMTAIFTPDTELADDTIYTVTLTTGIEDMAGNPLEFNYTWFFTTQEGLFNSPPDTPAALAPANASVLLPGPVSFQAGAFSDPENDAHTATYWSVRKANGYLCSDENVSYDDMQTTGDLTRYTASGLAPGLEYVWKVGYEDIGSEEISWSSESTFRLGVSETNTEVRIEPGAEAADYRMVSLPLWPDDASCSAVFGELMGGSYDRDNFRIGIYDPEIGNYVQCDEGMNIMPGAAFWILARHGLDIGAEGIPPSSSHSADVKLLYNPETGNGWNMIASPNNANYDWDRVEIVVYDPDCNVLYGPVYISQLTDSNPYLDKRLWRWEYGGHAPDTSRIERYKGYWVRVRSENVFLRFSVSAQTKTDARSRREDVSIEFRVSNNDDDSPPGPPVDLSVNLVKENGTVGGGGGCFVSTVSSDDLWEKFFAPIWNFIEKLVE